ncbi:phospholipase D1 [Cloeon dipterum]|uniref:phospholipase D1 n=1 Tax=Cloeon dipterum TaxID=197152 RepID=UPI003220253C
MVKSVDEESPGCSHSSSPGHNVHLEDEPQRAPMASSDEEDLESPLEDEKPDDEGVEGNVAPCIPFSSLYADPVKVNKAPAEKVYIPGKSIRVKVTLCERNATTRWQNPNVYTIELQHGEFSWVIKKRYKHFYHLHQQLRIFRAGLQIPFPTRKHRKKRESFNEDLGPRVGIFKFKRIRSLPTLPSMPDAEVKPEQMAERMKQLEKYLEGVLRIKVFRNHNETMNFLEVSPLSFVDQLGSKGKEGHIKKRTGSAQTSGCDILGIFNQKCCKSCGKFCSRNFGRWGRRWLFVKDTFVGYVEFKTGIIKSVMLMDRRFDVTQSSVPHYMKISNMNRSITVDCLTERKCKEWVAFLKMKAESSATDFTKPNRFTSFAPIRRSTEAAWFVDGAGYMAAAAKAIEAAKEEILIADWWLSPEIYLKRPANADHVYRLDKMLERKAAQGVKIFVLLFQEVKQALALNSKYTKQVLMSKHENIKVLRHPTHARTGIFLWAHHEKIIVIDQNYAFLGGLDLCYGRWDDHKHRLTDLGQPSSTTDGLSNSNQFLPHAPKLTSSNPKGNKVTSVWQLASSTNQLLRSMFDLRSEASQSSINKIAEENERREDESAAHPHMFAMAMRMNRIKRRFRSFYNSSVGAAKVDKRGTFTDTIASSGEESSDDETFAFDETLDDAEIGQAKLWLGKDYSNCIVKDFVDLESPFADYISREQTPRMPWHDIGVLVQGLAARDVARHFIQRWNAVKLEKVKNKTEYPYLVPKSNDTSLVVPPLNKKMPKVTCQIVRSVSQWSASFLHAAAIEQSIHEAYIDAIRNSSHFIYIENQFFITQVKPEVGKVENKINQALFDRIVAAHQKGETFRVIVVMPLLPAFEGEMGKATGGALHTITYYNYASICRGRGSLIKNLIDSGIEHPENYVSFYGLRTYATLKDELVSELIYVHSKLLIADDRLVICGSANINDRSLLGSRDSEIAVVIEDEEMIDSLMNGSPYLAGRYAGTMRRRIFREHLGLLESAEGDALVRDPVSDEFYHERWRKTADTNTDVFQKVFNCMPSDEVRNFQQLQEYQSITPLCLRDKIEARNCLKEVNGHLVHMPLSFLCEENLAQANSFVEGMLPSALWT